MFFFSDADELEWYIPAGIELSDLQRSLTVIEQFEKSPLDLNGKRASQLLHKKRRRRRRRRQASSSDSEGAGSSDEDAPRKKARKTRERETYKSAQFIEDSDEEYGRDIDVFITREAELRKRTALTAASAAAAAAAADGHQPQRLGTMRATGTKKRRRPQASRGTSSAKGRAAKRRALLSSSGTPGKNGEGEDGGINAVTPHRSPSPTASFDDDDHGANGAAHDDDDDGGGGGGVSGGIDVGGDSGGSGDDDDDEGDARQSSIVDRDVAGHRHPDSPQSPKSRRPKARPLYRRDAPLRATPAADATPDTPAAGTDDEEDDHDDGAGHDPSPTVPSLRVAGEDESTRRAKGGGSGGGGGGVSGGLRKGRLIISDEED